MPSRTLPLGFAPLILAAACCNAAAPPPEPPPAPPPEALPPAPVATAEPAAVAAPAAPPGPVVRYAEGIATPESVLYDAEADRYLVSNINGSPLEVDNNGYIAVLSPEGGVQNPKFIAGGVNKVTLNAPKGMTISQGTLYVTDITVVRKFDAKTGAPQGDIPVAGSSFLNDLTTAPDGRIYVSDSGLKMGEKGLESNGGDGIYVIDKGKVKPIAKYKELAGPNGLLANEDGLWVVPFGGNELYRVDAQGKRQTMATLPSGGLDGLVMAEGTLLISSWEGSAVLRGAPTGPFTPVVSDVKGPADIAYDGKRKRIVIPRFLDNVVEVYDLK